MFQGDSVLCKAPLGPRLCLCLLFSISVSSFPPYTSSFSIASSYQTRDVLVQELSGLSRRQPSGFHVPLSCHHNKDWCMCLGFRNSPMWLIRVLMKQAQLDEALCDNLCLPLHAVSLCNSYVGFWVHLFLSSISVVIMFPSSVSVQYSLTPTIILIILFFYPFVY